VKKITKDLINNPFVSVIIPAININNWPHVIKSLSSKKIKIEIIFLGPFKPKFTLPKNCRYIQTFVKPPQCLEIGYRTARGNFIMQWADDAEMQPQEGICKMFELWKNQGANIYKLLSCQYKTANHKTLIEDYRFMPWDKSSPLLPMHPLIPKILLNKYGSYDRRFTAVLADLDLYMRLIRAGCKFTFSNIYIMENKNINKGNMLLGDYWLKDKVLLDKMWIDNAKKPLEEQKFATKRNIKFLGFSNKNLTRKTQKPYGKWKNQSYYYNKIIHNSLFYFFKNMYNRKYFYQYAINLLKEYKIFRFIINEYKSYKFKIIK